MIYGKIWTVVNPAVGIPVFLGAVAVTSFAVHLTLVSNTTWIKAYHNGSAGKSAVVAMAAEPPAVAAPVAKK
jgi:light-harvesting protein B-800-850 alpha chain